MSQFKLCRNIYVNSAGISTLFHYNKRKFWSNTDLTTNWRACFISLCSTLLSSVKRSHLPTHSFIPGFVWQRGEVTWFVKSAGKYVLVLHLVLLLMPIVSRTGSSTGQMSTYTKEREAVEVCLLSASYWIHLDVRNLHLLTICWS